MTERVSRLTAIPIVVALGLCGSSAFGQEKVHKVGYIADLSGPMQDNYSPIWMSCSCVAEKKACSR